MAEGAGDDKFQADTVQTEGYFCIGVAMPVICTGETRVWFLA